MIINILIEKVIEKESMCVCVRERERELRGCWPKRSSAESLKKYLLDVASLNIERSIIGHKRYDNFPKNR